MGQTKVGAKKALQTIRSRYGDDWLKSRASAAGKASGKRPHPARFKKGEDRARLAGLKGAAERHKNANS